MDTVRTLSLALFILVQGIRCQSHDDSTCKNNREICKFFTQKSLDGYCKYNAFKDNCRLSCGLCPKKKYEDLDLESCPEDHPYCRILTDTKNLCKNTWMKNHCCRKCKRSEFFESGEHCQPDHHRCGFYKEKEFYCYQRWMQKNCCNYCRNTL